MSRQKARAATIDRWQRVGVVASAAWIIGAGLYAFCWRAEDFEAAKAISFSFGEQCLLAAKSSDNGLRCVSEEVRMRQALEPFNRSDVLTEAIRWPLLG